MQTLLLVFLYIPTEDVLSISTREVKREKYRPTSLFRKIKTDRMQTLLLVLHFYRGSIPGVIGEFLSAQNGSRA
jgi:hypothetical protein